MKAKQLEQEGNLGTTDLNITKNLGEKQSCLIALKSIVIILLTLFGKKLLKNFIMSFGGIFAPQRNKFKSARNQHIKILGLSRFYTFSTFRRVSK